MAVIGIFNTDVDAYDGTRRLYGHHGLRESALKLTLGFKKKIPCRSGDSNPIQYCAFQSDALLTELSIRFIRDGEKGMGRGIWRWGKREIIIYTCRYTVITRMTPALRWAAMGAILMFH